MKRIPLSLTAIVLMMIPVSGQVTMGPAGQSQTTLYNSKADTKAILSVSTAHAVLSGGRSSDGSIIALFDPGSRFFWWMYEKSVQSTDSNVITNHFLSSYAAAISPEGIVCFTASGRNLWVRSLSERYPTVEAGLAHVRAILPSELANTESGATRWFQPIHIAALVGQQFFWPKNIGDPPVQLTIPSVNRSGEGWRIDIKNDRGEIKTVLLGRDFTASTATIR